MYSEVFGYRVNLTHVVVIVAFYDLFHILYEFKQRFVQFEQLENDDIGCLGDLFQAHCMTLYAELGIYAIDFIFTVFLIYGASSLKVFPVLCWLVLSSYHLIDFVLMFTPFYEFQISPSWLSGWMWADIGCSVLGFFFVLFYFRKLVEVNRGGIERERLSNVDELNITGVDMEA